MVHDVHLIAQRERSRNRDASHRSGIELLSVLGRVELLIIEPHIVRNALGPSQPLSAGFVRASKP